MRSCTRLAMLLVAALAAAEAYGQKVKTRRIGEIEWQLDYDKAMKIAKETNRPLWLHFGEHPG